MFLSISLKGALIWTSDWQQRVGEGPYSWNIKRKRTQGCIFWNFVKRALLSASWSTVCSNRRQEDSAALLSVPDKKTKKKIIWTPSLASRSMNFHRRYDEMVFRLHQNLRISPKCNGNTNASHVIIGRMLLLAEKTTKTTGSGSHRRRSCFFYWPIVWTSARMWDFKWVSDLMQKINFRR